MADTKTATYIKVPDYGTIELVDQTARDGATAASTAAAAAQTKAESAATAATTAQSAATKAQTTADSATTAATKAQTTADSASTAAATAQSTADSALTKANAAATTATATTSTAGLMSASDKSKLDGIAAKANAYTLPTASASTLGGIKVGSGLSITSGVLSADAQPFDVADAVFIMDFTSDSSGNLTNGDNASWSALSAAYSAGKACYARVTGYPQIEYLPTVLPLFVYYSSGYAMFSGAGTTNGTSITGMTLTMQGDSATVALALAPSETHWIDVTGKPFSDIGSGLSVSAEQVLSADIPTALKNPNALTLTVGDETYTYDGSSAVSVAIEDGDGVSY